MYTVYGIYEQGAVAPVYVGCTRQGLDARFNLHVSDGVRQYCGAAIQPCQPVAKLKAYWMFKHAAGVITLEVRPLDTADTRREGLRMERDAIREHRPMLNCQTKGNTTRQQRRYISPFFLFCLTALAACGVGPVPQHGRCYTYEVPAHNKEACAKCVQDYLKSAQPTWSTSMSRLSIEARSVCLEIYTEAIPCDQ